MPRARISWNLADVHFHKPDALALILYSLIRDLIPAIFLVALPFANNTEIGYSLAVPWRHRQFGPLDMTLLVSLTICWRLIGGGKPAAERNWARSQVIGNVASALCCSAIVFSLGPIQSSLIRSLQMSLGFFVASSATSLLLVEVACVANWAVISFVLARREVILVGSGPRAQILYAELMKSPMRRVVGVVDDEFVGTLEMSRWYLGGIADLDQILRDHPVQTVYCALPIKSMYSETQRAISICAQIGVEVYHAVEPFATKFAQVDLHEGAHEKLCVLSIVRADAMRYVKRTIDIIGALLLLILTAPIVAAAAILIKLNSPGPILFFQERCGLHRRRFRIFKLRTMVVNAEQLQARYESMNELDGPVFKIRQDPRITAIGGFLRRTSIDELPQLWNVIKGDMSLVGPRPLALRDFHLIDDSGHLRRFCVKPGITCLWQISGRNNTSFEDWVRLDLEYIERWSLFLDVSILLRTVPAVLSRRGAM
ncbi:MAG: exopolysaccharide biosynthesis polyprenyl glycosylphosphotransferase [Terracidiphilus sp.]